MRARSSSAARYTDVSCDSSAGLHNAAPRLLLGDVAARVDRRALGGVSPAFGRGEHFEALAGRPGRLVFLDQPGADHVIDAAPGGVGVAVKMLVGQVCVRHGAIEPHVGHRIARACGPAAARPVVRLGVVRARGVFPPMARGACLRVVRARVARVRANGFVLAIPRILARPVILHVVVPRRLGGRASGRRLARADRNGQTGGAPSG